MSLPVIYGLNDLIQVIATAFGADADTPANIGEGSQFGPSFNAVALAMLLLQDENVYIDSIARLSTMQDPLRDGSPNPDVDTYINDFNFYRNGSTPAQLYCTFSINSPAGPSGVVVPVGTTVAPNGGTPAFVVSPNGSGYSQSANGYVIPPGQTSVSALTICTVNGVAGNVLPGTVTVVIVGPGQQPSPFSVTNPTGPSVVGVATEVGQPLYTRFANYISGGGEGTANSILAAAAGVQTGLTISYGDYWKSNAGGSGVWTSLDPNHIGYFTLVVANANSGADPGDSGALANTITTALLLPIRSGGIGFTVVYPKLTTINGSGQVHVLAGFDKPTVVAAVAAAYTTFVNGINLDPFGNATVCSIARCYAALQQVAGVDYVDNLQFNDNAADVVMNFGYMASAGTTTGFVAA